MTKFSGKAVHRTGNTVCTADGRSEPGQKSSVVGFGKVGSLPESVVATLVAL